MTHNELLKKINWWKGAYVNRNNCKRCIKYLNTLRAVVELHKPSENYTGNACGYCFDLNYEPTGLSMEYESFAYPCSTIQVIEKELA